MFDPVVSIRPLGLVELDLGSNFAYRDYLVRNFVLVEGENSIFQTLDGCIFLGLQSVDRKSGSETQSSAPESPQTHQKKGSLLHCIYQS